MGVYVCTPESGKVRQEQEFSGWLLAVAAASDKEACSKNMRLVPTNCTREAEDEDPRVFANGSTGNIQMTLALACRQHYL